MVITLQIEVLNLYELIFIKEMQFSSVVHDFEKLIRQDQYSAITDPRTIVHREAMIKVTRSPRNLNMLLTDFEIVFDLFLLL